MMKSRRTAPAKPVTIKAPAEQVVKNIRRATRKLHSSEEKIRIVLSGLRGEDSIAELCRKEGIAQSLYYSWSKEFLEAGKKRLAGDTARQANTGEVKDLRAEALALNELVGECPIFCVSVIWSMLPERSKDDDDFERTAGRTAEGLQAA